MFKKIKKNLNKINLFKLKKVERPWGGFVNLWQKGLNIKIISVNPHSRLSLQSHKLRSEIFFLISGNLECQINNKRFRMKRGVPYLILRGAKHRLSAFEVGGKVLEVSFGKFHEEDIIRYEDDYGRIN